MRIVVSLFGPAATLAGMREAELELEQGSVAGLEVALAARFGPQIAALAARSRVARGAELLAHDAELVDGDRLALLPPVSGG
jgi:molybdopterin converting factor small subunit